MLAWQGEEVVLKRRVSRRGRYNIAVSGVERLHKFRVGEIADDSVSE